MTSISRSFYFFTQKFNISDRQLLAHCAHRYSKRGKDRGQALEKETKLFKNRFCWFIYFSGKSSFSPSDVFFGKTKIVSCQKIGPDQLFFWFPKILFVKNDLLWGGWHEFFSYMRTVFFLPAYMRWYFIALNMTSVNRSVFVLRQRRCVTWLCSTGLPDDLLYMLPKIPILV
jgi:hypothetical protein